MISIGKLKQVIEGYKKYFPKHWEDEKFKWIAIKTFQDNWDINANDFADMITRSLSGTESLLASMNNYPAQMIESFSKSAPEEVRAMFTALFDEDKDVVERILQFKAESNLMLEKYGNGAGQHYQNENSISTYLWLRFPDKYYIYKYSEIKAVSKELENDFEYKKGAYTKNLRNFFAMYDEIAAEIIKDSELINLLKTNLTSDCYSDNKYHTLTVDIGFYLSRFYLDEIKAEQEENAWFPNDYNPGISVEQWKDLLNDSSVFTTSALQIMKRIRDYGGQATCKQLATKYGENSNFYNAGSSALAKRVAKKTGCEVMVTDNEKEKWWPVLYTGRDAGSSEVGSFIWKLRNELAEALDMIDLSDVALFATNDTDEYAEHKNYWWYTVNPKYWSYSDIKVGEEVECSFYNANGNKRRIFKYFFEAKPGDIVIGYESQPVKNIVAIAKVSRIEEGKALYLEKTEVLSSPIDYYTLKDCPELAQMEFLLQANGSLLKLSNDEFEFLMDLIREENPIKTAESKPKYTKDDFLSKVFMDESRYNALEALLRNKKNIILQGAPGVGKTFAAKKLAYAMMGEVDDSRIEFVQFHQNYSYEDFIMGYRPDGEGFKLTDGIFYRFCKAAENNPDKEYFFIIDEINRGNMSKIFGELMMLIEKDYRGTKATLAYSGMPFSVPENLYIIGMMNTADRSLAMIDYALRRRFSFFEIEPGFNSDGFRNYLKSFNNETFDELIDEIIELNIEINKDDSLGSGFRIGHSYFCGREGKGCTDDWLRSVVDFDILPMLSEYWFDNKEKLQRWEKNLRGVFND